MKYLIEIRKKYLRIPVDLTGQVKNVCFYVDGKKEGQYEIPLCCDEKKKSCDFYAEYPSEAWIGKTVELVTDDDTSMTILPEQSDELIERDQLQYPYIHFAPVSGWMNEVIKMRHYERMTFVPQIIHLDFIQEVQEVSGGFHLFCRCCNCFSRHLPLTS